MRDMVQQLLAHVRGHWTPPSCRADRTNGGVARIVVDTSASQLSAAVGPPKVVCDRPGDGRSLAYGGHRVIFWKISHRASGRTSRGRTSAGEGAGRVVR